MAVEMIIQFEGKQLTLPINPEKLRIDRSASNETLDIVGLGKTARKGEVGLTQISLESFFPASNSYFYTGVSPRTCVDFINKIWHTENKNNNVGRIIISGLPLQINMLFVIDNFVPEIRAGEEDDVYYTLDIKEYIPYGVKIVEVQTSGLAASRAASTATTKNTPTTQNNQTPQPTQKTYTVVKGDCLWNITKKFTGNGSRWKELYDINKSVIGNNPNLIYPGAILTLPVGW